MQVLGVDVGGSGVKAAIVDTESGEMVTERHRIPTPQPATPDAVVGVIEELVRHFEWSGPIGCGVPGVVQHGVMRTSANLDKGFTECDVAGLISGRTGCDTRVLNDADAAGLAEVRFGAGRGIEGTVIVITLGTGIGSGTFLNGQLVPNTEFGHIELDGHDAEKLAADSAREREDLSWKKWSKRVDDYLHALRLLTWPDRVIIGGGVSKKHEKFLPHLKVEMDVVPAELRNQAGIIGAAMVWC